MNEDSAERLDRLGRAVDVFLAHRAAHPIESEDAASQEALLAEYADLRDLLEPMFQKAESSEAEADPSLDHIGGYRILREVGRGGMGVVFEAIEESLDRRVALKVLSPHMTASPQAIERFRREAGAAANLRHDAIVPIFAVGDSAGAHYFAMEFIHGQSLATVLASGADSLGVMGGVSRSTEAAEIVARIAEALDYVHSCGVVHRDVKPHNIMVADDGRVLLVDFGLAHDQSESNSHQFAGTPYYMSPEQAHGSESVDGRSDIFSLGATLFELLTGARPFAGESTAEVFAALDNRQPPVELLREARVARDLEIICCKALEKSPGDRYQTAAEFAADLRRFLRHETILAVAPSTISRSFKFVRRHYRSVTAAALLLVVATGAGIAFALQAEQQERRENEHFDRQRAAVQALLAVSTRSDLQRRPRQTEECRAHINRVTQLCRELLDHPTQDVPAELQRRFGSHMLQAGEFYLGLGAQDEAHASFKAAAAVFDALAQGSNKIISLTNRTICEANLAIATQDTSALDSNIEQLRKIRPDASEVSPSRTLQVLVNHRHAALGLALGTRANIAAHRGRYGAATVADLRAATREWDRAGEELRDKIGRGSPYAWLQATRAFVSRKTGNLAEAFQAIQTGMLHLEPLLQREPENRRFLTARARLYVERGTTALTRGTLEACRAAEKDFEAAIQILKDLVRDFSMLESDGIALSEAESALASCWTQRRRNDAALKLLREARARIEKIRPRAPGPAAAIIDAKIGYTLSRSQPSNHAAIEAHFAAARKEFERLLAEDPMQADLRTKLAGTLSNEAQWRMMRQQTSAARKLAHQAIDQQRMALARHPKAVVARQFRRTHSALLFASFAKDADHANLFAAAETLHRDLPDDAVACGQAALAMCKSIGFLREDHAIPESERTAREQRYGDYTISVLRQAVKLGIKGANGIPNVPAFAVLREHEQFRELEKDILARMAK